MVETKAIQESPHHARVRAVFEGRWPDRIPICEQVIPPSVATDFLGRPAYTGSSELLYRSALAWMRGKNAHEEFLEQVFNDTIAIHRMLDLDILFLPSPGGPPPTKQLDEYTFLFGNPDTDNWTVCKFDPESHQFGAIRSGRPPLTLDDVAKTMRDTIARAHINPQPPSLSPFLERAAREYGHEFVIGGTSFMNIPMQPAWLEATILERGLVEEYLDVVVENNLRSMALQRKMGIRLFNGGGDFASNTGPIYSPRFFDEVMAPRWKRLFDWCRENDAWYVFRSDGNLWPVADLLFGWARPHAYYEVDHDAGMHFDKLRARFPDLVLIGNVSCDVLQRGTPYAVREFTLRCLEAAAPRVIIGSANSLLHGTPRANVLAMYETAKNYKYKEKCLC